MSAFSRFTAELLAEWRPGYDVRVAAQLQQLVPTLQRRNTDTELRKILDDLQRTCTEVLQSSLYGPHKAWVEGARDLAISVREHELP